MDLKTQFTIRNNPYLANYLRENSYWYKSLTRNPSAISELEQEVKEKYHLTMKDKIEGIGEKLEMIQEFMRILK